MTITTTTRASRTTGVAPLSVTFNAIGTTGDGIDKPFHNLAYIWNFNDSNVTGKRGWASNPVAAHVFTEPGTYDVDLYVYSDTESATDTITVTVDDPETIFSGTDTYAFSTGGNFDGAPAGSSGVVTSDLATVLGYVDTNRRLLLRRGERWTCGDGQILNGIVGPVYVGAFGSGSGEDLDRGYYENDPVIQATGSFAGDESVMLWTADDVRIEHLRFIDGGANPWGFLGVASLGDHRVKDFLVHKCQFEGSGTVRVPLGFGSDVPAYNDTYNDAFCFWNCVAQSGETNVTYNGGHNSAIGYCYFGSASSHIVRLTHFPSGIFIGNTCRNSWGDTHRHNLKFHAQNIDENSYSVIAENTFIAEGQEYWSVTIGPQDTITNETVRDTIVDGNYFSGTTNDLVESLHIMNAYDITIRNNSFLNLSGGGWDYDVIDIHDGSTAGAPGVSGVLVYNNSAWVGSNNSHHNTVFLDVDDHSGTLIARNNSYMVGNTPGEANDLFRTGGISTETSNNYFSVGVSSPLDYADPDNGDLSLQSDSPNLLNSGYTVGAPAYLDADRKVRPSSNVDIGALEYGASEYSFLEYSSISDDYAVSSFTSYQSYLDDEYSIDTYSQYSNNIDDLYNIYNSFSSSLDDLYSIALREFFSQLTEQYSLTGLYSGNVVETYKVGNYFISQLSDNYKIKLTDTFSTFINDQYWILEQPPALTQANIAISGQISRLKSIAGRNVRPVINKYPLILKKGPDTNQKDILDINKRAAEIRRLKKRLDNL